MGDECQRPAVLAALHVGPHEAHLGVGGVQDGRGAFERLQGGLDLHALECGLATLEQCFALAQPFPVGRHGHARSACARLLHQQLHLLVGRRGGRAARERAADHQEHQALHRIMD